MRPGYRDSLALEGYHEAKTADYAQYLVQPEDVISRFARDRFEMWSDAAVLDGDEAEFTVRTLHNLAKLNMSGLDPRTIDPHTVKHFNGYDAKSKRELLGCSDMAFEMLKAYVAHEGFTSNSPGYVVLQPEHFSPQADRRRIPRRLTPKLQK